MAEEAIQKLNSMLALAQEVNLTGLAASLEILAKCFKNMSDCAEAIRWYEQCLSMRRHIHGEEADRPDIASIMEVLGECHEQLGNRPEAATWREKSREMRQKL